MTQTIEQLTARIAELEADRDQWMRDCKTFHREMEKREQQILSLQAYAEQLREALDEMVELCTPSFCECDPDVGYQCRACNPIEAVKAARELLSLPRDTSALDAYVAKRLHDMACDKGLLRIQVEELTRQRDLAVEALEWACGEKPNDEGKWFDAPDGAPKYWWRTELRKALSAIKSEAMAQGEKKGV